MIQAAITRKHGCGQCGCGSPLGEPVVGVLADEVHAVLHQLATDRVTCPPHLMPIFSIVPD